MVVFDLDDTLVPVANQLKIAYDALEQYMLEHMPNTSKVIKEQLQPTMKK